MCRRRGRRFWERERAIGKREIAHPAWVRMIGLEPAKEAEAEARAGIEPSWRILDDGKRMLVLAARARQALGFETHRRAARTRREAVELERVGAKARRLRKRTDQCPRMALADGEILSRRQHDPVRGMRQRRVIEVLADVVLVEAHGAVIREGEVLRVEQVNRLDTPTAILDRDMPEPGRRRRSQSQRHTKAKPFPLTGDIEAALVEPHGAGTSRTEQRRPFDARAAPTQKEIGGASLDLVPEEGIDQDIAMIDAADRAVGIHLDGELRRTGDADRSMRAHGAWSRSHCAAPRERTTTTAPSRLSRSADPGRAT